MLSVRDIKNFIEPVVRDTNVVRVVLFGSYAKGTANINSDIDLYVFSGGAITGLAFYDLKAKIEDALATQVDLIPDLDVITDSPVHRHILESGVVVYER